MSALSLGSVDLVGSLALGAFALLSFVDGIWIHLVRLGLYAAPDSRSEHLAHTGRALLFPVLLLTVFSPGSPTPARWIGWTALLVDQLLELVDMAIERRSRSALGGLSSAEYVTHGALITLRTVAISAALSLHAVGSARGHLDALSGWLLPGAVLAAIAHVVLAAAPGLPRMARASLVAARAR